MCRFAQHMAGDLGGVHVATDRLPLSALFCGDVCMFGKAYTHTHIGIAVFVRTPHDNAIPSSLP